MSGLVRNLLVIVLATLFRRRADTHSQAVCYFWITPFDCGISVLKSDKYLQLAECAQIDFLIKTRVVRQLLREGIRFVNSAQLVKFTRPIGVFSRVRLETMVVCADEKCAYFSHSLFVGQERHGQILVKMKFKDGPVTVRPAELLGRCAAKPPHVLAWDQVIDGMAEFQ